MKKKATIILISMLVASVFMAGGYGSWQEELMIIGNFTVLDPPQDDGDQGVTTSLQSNISGMVETTTVVTELETNPDTAASQAGTDDTKEILKALEDEDEDGENDDDKDEKDEDRENDDDKDEIEKEEEDEEEHDTNPIDSADSNMPDQNGE